MAGNLFIRFTGPSGSPFPGESQSTQYPGAVGGSATGGWVEIGDWSWDIESETNIQKGSGASLGKPTSGNFSFTHPYDISSSPFMLNIVKGTSFPKCELLMLKQVGNGSPSPYFGMIFTNVFITKVSSKGSEDGSVTQDVEFVFTKVDVGYLMQTPGGTLSSQESSFEWDIVKQAAQDSVTVISTIKA